MWERVTVGPRGCVLPSITACCLPAPKCHWHFKYVRHDHQLGCMDLSGPVIFMYGCHHHPCIICNFWQYAGFWLALLGPVLLLPKVTEQTGHMSFLGGQLPPAAEHAGLCSPPQSHKARMQEVARRAGDLGWAGLHVQPLGVSAAAQGARRGQASTDAGQLRLQLLQLLGQNSGTHTQQTPLLMACLQVQLWAVL